MLEWVHVLELVDVEVAVAPADGGGIAGIGPEVPDGQGEEIIEVDQALAPLLLLVADHDLGQVIDRDRGLAPGCPGGRPVALGLDRPGPGPVDLGHHVGGVDAASAADELGHEPDLAVEQVRGRDPPLGPTLAQLGQGHGVEGAGRDPIAQAEGPAGAP